MVHVQVRNRADVTQQRERVGGLRQRRGGTAFAEVASPSLGNNFNFWSQFSPTGQILPSLPGDGPWRSLGTPVILTGVDVTHPRVASWSWTVPTLPSGDPGHYCVVAFVHHSASPINGTGFDVDAITPGNKQIGQKNLHIGPPLPAEAPPGRWRARRRAVRRWPRRLPDPSRIYRVQQPDGGVGEVSFVILRNHYRRSCVFPSCSRRSTRRSRCRRRSPE